MTLVGGIDPGALRIAVPCMLTEIVEGDPS